MPPQDLIIGMVRGYTFEQLRPFLKSLQSTNYTGQLALLCNSLDDLTLQELAAQPRTTLWPVAYSGHGAENKWSRAWPWVKALVAALPDSELKYQIVGFFSNIATIRFLYARKYLLANGHKYRRVLLTDVRDVIFQADPFRDDKGAELSAFLEAPKMVFGNEPLFNDAWIMNNYGAELASQLNGKRISCCGTVMGTVDGILRYLDLFAREMSKLMSMSWGADTSIHNKIVYGPLLETTHIRENINGGVGTIANVSDTEIVFHQDGWLLNETNMPVPILHQYRIDHIERVFSAMNIESNKT